MIYSLVIPLLGVCRSPYRRSPTGSWGPGQHDGPWLDAGMYTAELRALLCANAVRWVLFISTAVLTLCVVRGQGRCERRSLPDPGSCSLALGVSQRREVGWGPGSFVSGLMISADISTPYPLTHGEGSTRFRSTARDSGAG